MTRIYIVTLVDAVHYCAEIEAETPAAASAKARQLWEDDFLRFKPVDDGIIDVLSVTPLAASETPAAGGAR